MLPRHTLVLEQFRSLLNGRKVPVQSVRRWSNSRPCPLVQRPRSNGCLCLWSPLALCEYLPARF